MSKKQTLRGLVEASDESLQEAAEILLRGGLVAFPTETVYGLGANAHSEEAVRGIFAAKGRPAYNPLIVHVRDIAAAKQLVTSWPDEATKLAELFWPGPLTMVLPKQAIVPDLVTAGLETVALRVPSHPVAQALLAAAGIPLAAPSANRSMGVSPTTAQHVQNSLGSRIDLILDGGSTDVGIESIVIDLSGKLARILRPGSISAAQIESVIGPVTTAGGASGSLPRSSPGMLDRHYAPNAALELFDQNEQEQILKRLKKARSKGEKPGAIIWSGADVKDAETIQLAADPIGYARTIYAALHTLDDLGCNLILVEALPPTPEWSALRDRLKRATTA